MGPGLFCPQRRHKLFSYMISVLRRQEGREAECSNKTRKQTTWSPGCQEDYGVVPSWKMMTNVPPLGISGSTWVSFPHVTKMVLRQWLCLSSHNGAENIQTHTTCDSDAMKCPYPQVIILFLACLLNSSLPMASNGPPLMGQGWLQNKGLLELFRHVLDTLLLFKDLKA